MNRSTSKCMTRIAGAFRDGQAFKAWEDLFNTQSRMDSACPWMQWPPSSPNAIRANSWLMRDPSSQAKYWDLGRDRGPASLPQRVANSGLDVVHCTCPRLSGRPA
jgi:hypothetical protein